MPSFCKKILAACLICIAGFASLSNGEFNKVDELNSRLDSLRLIMKNYDISAYIVPNEDNHQSEETAAADKRREYISGFTGSAGHALITQDNATLWTDGRYHIQAEQELPSSWTLERLERVAIPSMKYWLVKHLKKKQKVAIDPKKVHIEEWNQLKEFLIKHEIQLIPLVNNLVDEIWEDRPKYSTEPLFVHDIKYSGELYERKLERLREKIKSSKSDYLVVTSLSEIAWLFNLRGSDIPHSPLFVSYAVISQNNATLYIESNKITPLIQEHLSKPGAEVVLHPYDNFWDDLNLIGINAQRVFIPAESSYAVHLLVPKNITFTSPSPIIDMKAVKNEVEVKGSRNAHIRDAIALCALFKRMEAEVPNGIHWDEMKVAHELDQLRHTFGQNLYKGPSFQTIAAFGSHSALPHYVSHPHTNTVINTTAPMTLDSGGQYLDGTIDTTRVVHFGEPTDFQKQVYTLLLQGVADLADTVFPIGIRGDALDILTRRPLLKLGLTFSHGTTHGTGVFSEVHERFNGTYFENFIGSQEPGYYLKDHFGMRLENLVVVVKADVQNEHNPKTLLAFSPLTLVPYEYKLINTTLLDFRQILWLNNYHDTVKRLVGDEMISLGRQDLFNWLSMKTEPIVQLH